MNSHRLLDSIKAEFNLRNDAALVRFLECDKTKISKIRAGKVIVTAEIILKVHDATDWQIKHIKSFL